MAERQVYVLLVITFFMLFLHGDIIPREEQHISQLKTSTNGIELIKKHEGFSAVPYRCSAGIVAIGYGSTTYENKKPVLLSDPPITEKTADILLIKNITKYEKSVKKLVKTNINQNQFDALISLTYNIGMGNIKSSQLIKLINIDPNDPAIKDEFLKWRKASGKVIKGLELRRQQEVELYYHSFSY